MAVAREMFRGGRRFVHEDDCSYLWKIPISRRCEWVRGTEDCLTLAEIQYTRELFCTFESKGTTFFVLGLVIYVLWLVYLFLILGITADNFFCPALGVIAEVMHLSDNIAGVTILAFGNGAPDIFTALVSPVGKSVVMLNELLGAGVFVTAIIAGTIAIVSPFRVRFQPFIRDTMFYILAVSWIAYVVNDERVALWEAISLILIYVLFIIVVIVGQLIENKNNRIRDRIPSLHNSEVLRMYLMNRDETVIPRLTIRSRAVGYHSKIDVALHMERKNAISRGEMVEEPSPEVTWTNRPTGLFREFLFDISPINVDDWNEAGTALRIFFVIRAVPMFFLQLLIPVVNQTAVKRGWSKLLNCTQLWLTPFLAAHVLQVWDYGVGPIPVPLIILVLGLIASLTVFCITRKDRTPKYHNVFAFLGFLSAMLMVYLVANHVYAVLDAMGVALRISEGTLGLMFLAWGNSIGDLLSNVSVAKHGFPRMGFAACFGGPLFNTLLGMGLTNIIAASQREDYTAKARASTMGPGCIAFLLCSLTCSICYLSTTGYIARRSYGFMLYSVYLSFMIFCILSEVAFIHPLGTDHRDD